MSESLMEQAELRICTVADGLEAVLRLAGLVARLQGVASRVDLQLSEASEHFVKAESDAYDLILVAPHDLQRSPDTLYDVLDKAGRISAELFLVQPEVGEIALKLPSSIHLITGPPFPKGGLEALLAAGQPALEMGAKAVAGQGSGLTCMLRRLRRADRVKSDGCPTGTGPFASAKRAMDTIVVQGTCGGAGATTLAVNLAAEIAACNEVESGAPTVCLLDLSLQFGGVANYLDLQETSHVSDVYRNLARLDSDAFMACTQSAGHGLQVFTAPPDLIPMDALREGGFDRLLECARTVAPLVVIDMPPILTDWSENAYGVADRVLCVSLLDVRSAHNARKLSAIMRALRVPHERVKHVLNRAPLNQSEDWALRLRNFEAGLGTVFEAILPEGGAKIIAAGDLGQLLRKACPTNPFAKEIHRLALTIPMHSTNRVSEVLNVNL